MFEKLKRIRINNRIDFSKFDCGCDDLNDFIKNDALNYYEQLLAVTYIYMFDNEPVAFVCFSNDKIHCDLIEKKKSKSQRRKFQNIFPHSKRLNSYPAVKLGRLGVDKKYKGENIGTSIILTSMAWFLDKNKTGCRFMTVDAYLNNDVYKFYEKLKFKQLVPPEDNAKTVLMYFDLYTIYKSFAM